MMQLAAQREQTLALPGGDGLVVAVQVNQTNLFKKTNLVADAFNAMEDDDLIVFSILMGPEANAMADEESITIAGIGEQPGRTFKSGHELKKEIARLTTAGNSEDPVLAQYTLAFSTKVEENAQRLSQLLTDKLDDDDDTTLPARYQKALNTKGGSYTKEAIIRDVMTNYVSANAVDRENKYSLLYHAVQSGKIEFARKLVLMGADLDYKPQSRPNTFSPRELIARKNQPEWTDLLAFAPAAPKKELSTEAIELVKQLENFCKLTRRNHIGGFYLFGKPLEVITLEEDVAKVEEAITNARQTGSIEAFNQVYSQFNTSFQISGDPKLVEFRKGLIGSYEAFKRSNTPNAPSEPLLNSEGTPQPATTESSPAALVVTGESQLDIVFTQQAFDAAVARKVDELVTTKIDQMISKRLEHVVEQRVQQATAAIQAETASLKQTLATSSQRLDAFSGTVASAIQTAEESKAIAARLETALTQTSEINSRLLAFLTSQPPRPDAAPVPAQQQQPAAAPQPAARSHQAEPNGSS